MKCIQTTSTVAFFQGLPTVQLCILQVIKNWTVEGLGNEATSTAHVQTIKV